MGTLRFLLAWSVLIGHLEILPFTLVRGGLAVIGFYMVSGFLMAMVLDEKYTHLDRWRGRFLINRFLRLFPMYFITAGIAFFVYKSYGRLDNPAPSYPWWIVPNITVFGQDFMVVFGYTGAFGGASPTLLVPQAFSIATELLFYCVIAALPSRTSRALVPIVAGLGLVRLSIALFVGTSDIWIYYFPPAVMVFFFLGALSWRLYSWQRPFLPEYSDSMTLRRLTWIFSVVMIVFAYTTSKYQPLDSLRSWVLYGGVLAGLPLWWHASRDSRLDSLLGDFSYPLYLTHILVRDVGAHLFPERPPKVTVAIIIATLGASAMLTLLTRPIDRLRRAIASSPPSAAPISPLAAPLAQGIWNGR